MKAIANNKMNMTEKLKLVLGSVENIMAKGENAVKLFTTIRERPFENIVGKAENAGNQHFLLFPQSCLLFPRQNSNFETHLLCQL